MTQLQQEDLIGITVTVYERNFFYGGNSTYFSDFEPQWVEGETFPIEHTEDIINSLKSIVTFMKDNPLRLFSKAGYPPYEYKLTFRKAR